MRKFACAFLEFFCLFVPCVCVGLELEGGNYIFDEDFVIDENEEIHIIGSGTIINYRVLRGTIQIDDELSVTFQNFGQIESDFVLGDHVAVTQNITSQNDMHILGSLTGYDVYVNTTNPDGSINRINTADLINMIVGASGAEVVYSELILDTNVPNNNVIINVNNTTVFYIDGLPDDLSRPLLTGLNGTPFVKALNIDPMYEVRLNRNLLPDLYLSVVRRTDYSEIMPDTNLGNYLDDLRDKNPDDKLLAALDVAPDRKTLNNILSESARVNPIKLMDAPRSINTFYDSMALDDVAFGIIARPFYIASSDFHFIGGAINVTSGIAKNTVGTVGINGGMLKFNGDYDEYSGTLYGGNVGVRYIDDNFYLRAFATMSYSNFSDINAFDGTRTVQNVNGIGGMGAVDAGLVYRASQEIKLIPFIGARADYVSVLNDTQMDASARAGLNATVDTDMDGNKYKFGARLLGQSDGSLYAGIYTDMMSTADGVGGGASVGILYDDMGLSYKLELNIKFEF